MDIANPTGFFLSFPKLVPGQVNVTSPVDPKYNCIAWAAGESRRWWWPSATTYWPKGVPRVATVDAFLQAYGTLGFVPTIQSDFEDGKDRIALFTLAGVPTHAARQLANGRWTSKCGANVDMEHDLTDLDGPTYGSATHFLERPVKAQP